MGNEQTRIHLKLENANKRVWSFVFDELDLEIINENRFLRNSLINRIKKTNPCIFESNSELVKV